MSERIFVKPAKGVKFQKCFSDVGRKEIIKDEGENVPNTLFYRRALKRGELVRVEPKTELVKEPKTTAKNKKNGGK